MKNKQITIEQSLYAGVFLIALAIRFIRLGQLPLGDSEAKLALQALELVRHQPILYQGAQSLYLVGTTALFFLLGPSTFLARLIPALAGTLLCLVPLLFHEKIGQKAALVLAFLLAIDPGLVAVSRSADGRMLSVLFLAAGFAFFQKRKTALAGVSLGLALLGGPSIWLGLLICMITWLIVRFVLGTGRDGEDRPEMQPFDWRQGLLWLGGTVLAIGSLGMLVPDGISAAGLGLVNFWKGWFSPSGISFAYLILALIVYQPVGLVLGVIQSVVGFRNESLVDRALFTGWMVALVVVLVYPAHQAADLVWCLAPLLALAARQLADLLEYNPEQSRETIIYAACAAALTVFLFFDFLNIFGNMQGESDIQLRLIRAVIAIVLLAISGILVYILWGTPMTVKGLSWGILAALSFFCFSTTWSAAGLGNDPAAQIWRADPLFGQENLFTSSVTDISTRNNSDPQSIEIVVQGLDSPALRWVLRDDSNAIFSDTLPVDAKPDMIVTADQPGLSQPAEYSGQDFTWEEAPNWSILLPKEWLRWFAFKTAPSEKTSIILWVRSDLFPTGTTSNSQS